MARIRYSTETFGPRFSETVLKELSPDFSRSKATVTVDTPLPFGLVLARAASGSKYEPYKSGGQAACAVLLTPLEEKGDQQAVILTGYAILNESRLVWSAAADQGAGLRQLEEKGFKLQRVALPPTDAEEPEEKSEEPANNQDNSGQSSEAPVNNQDDSGQGKEADNANAE